MSKHEYKTQPVATEGMPGGIPYIIGNEAAERFSFYGMKSILTIFMVDYLHLMGGSFEAQGMSGAEATEHYHSFTAAVYFFPILGALIADVVFGKYKTILLLSIVYCLGHGALALMGTPPIEASMWLVLGLFLISVGSGGIKPCVSAHVGDQFGKSNQGLLTKVYQWFYFSINFGSFVSTLLTPWLLQHYGPHWAFGIPGVLMAIATLMFWFGRNKFVHVPAGGSKFLAETLSLRGLAALAKLMVIFSFVAVFWALFDQTGSSWVLQAKNLNREWLGVTWLESQIQAVNPILVLALIPVFQFLIYPAIDKVFPLTHIRKISIGLFIMIGGFAIVALLQERIDAGEQPSIAWQFLAYGVLTASEVMVSITCLEFAYTQSPKTMKSVVMAVFLMSVSLGNVFTAVVNNYIQTPSASSLAGARDPDNSVDGMPIENKDYKGTLELSGNSSSILVAGFDEQPGTDDDLRLQFKEDGSFDGVNTAANQALEDAAELIQNAILNRPGENKSFEMIGAKQGNELLDGQKDAFGNQILYQLLSRDQFRLTSAGADKISLTKWDLILTSDIKRAEQTTAAEDEGEPYFSWKERRIIELKGAGDPAKTEAAKNEIITDRQQVSETEFTHSFSVGGLTTLQGASYFWFWTKCIFVTSVLFVPVGLLYRERTYIQDEADSDGEESSGESKNIGDDESAAGDALN